jgi:hypothetical protein
MFRCLSGAAHHASATAFGAFGSICAYHPCHPGAAGGAGIQWGLSFRNRLCWFGPVPVSLWCGLCALTYRGLPRRHLPCRRRLLSDRWKHGICAKAQGHLPHGHQTRRCRLLPRAMRRVALRALRARRGSRRPWKGFDSRFNAIRAPWGSHDFRLPCHY